MQHTLDSFPRTYASIRTSRLLEAYEAAPDRLRKAMRGFPLAMLRAQPRPSKWSIVEVAAHVVDSELIGAARIRYVLAQPGIPLPSYDQDVWTVALGHRGLDASGLERALSLFENLRRSTAGYLRRASSDDWQKTGIHAEFGPITLRHLLELYADHAERHLAQILEMRAMLGAPLELPVLLRERLY